IIADNNAKNRGGGMINSIEVNIRIYNSIIWGNTKDGVDADNIYNYSTIGSVRYYHSLIQGSGGSVAWDITFGKDGGNNIDSDPLFTEAANDDYTLADNSPAINAGNNTYYTDAGGDLANDLDLAGNPRLVGANIDMGAYENQSAVNEPPNITTSGGTTTFTKPLSGSPVPVAVDADLTITDSDNTTLASAN